MDRPIAYTQEQGRSTDFLFAQRSTMIAIAKLSQAVFGSNTVVRGLAVTPNSPAALNVLVGIGEIYTLASVDATTYGSLPADTTDQIVQQGLNMAAQTISTPAPSTAGYSINYLIEAQFQSQDTNPVVLPFYNSANPQQPLNGQGGNGATLPTQRQGVCVIQAKAGIAATTGTQVTPSVDSGWTALAVVTVANGQASVGSGNITIPAGVPQISSLLQMLQTGSANYAVDTSASANTISLSLTPSITAYGDGNPFSFKAANSNTGSVTINWGGGSVALNGPNGALQGGEIIAGKQYEAIYNVTTGTAQLIGQAGGALQIAPATQSQHAVQMAQAAGVVGGVRNGKMYLSAAASTGTYTADEVIVETALGGIRYCLANYNQTVNLATTGAGGMDTGTAPVSGYVALYAIYKPSTGTVGILATNANSLVSNVYGGANMPAGYTASALVAVVPTDGTGKIKPVLVQDRVTGIAITTALTSNTVVGALTPISLSAVIPANAKAIAGELSIASTSTSTVALTVAADSNSISQQNTTASVGSSGYVANYAINLATAQTISWSSANTAGTPTYVIYVSSYSI